jgi:ribosome-interacting GTPase 1
LDDFVIAYLNNNIIYLNSEEEHKEHIKWVLRKLYKENMPVTVKKYKFYTKKTNFIGFIIELRQISMDLKKIKAIVNWQDLESVIGLRLFLKFCNYYCRFIIK